MLCGTMKTKKYTYLKDYTPSNYLIPETFLEFDLYPERTVVSSRLHIIRQNYEKNDHLILNGENLELLEVTLNNEPVPYRLTEQYLMIINPPEDFTLSIKVAINPQKNLTGLGLYLSNGIYCTQNEPHGFRTITYHLDRPDVLIKFSVLIHAPSEFTVVASNGNLIKHSVDSRQHFLWEDPFPKSVYLFALVAGKLATLTESYVNSRQQEVCLKIHAAENQINACHTALTFLKQAMRWDEEVFGLFYDLNLYQIVAVDDFNFGAMENKSLNLFNSKLLLLDPDLATDDDYRRVASTVAHEYFHNWTGNRVTLRNWFQIGLKEGLTTLREQMFMEDLYGQDYNRIEAIQYLINYQFPEDSERLAHPIQPKRYQSIDNFYTHTVYEKSSEVFRILINRFGRQVFIRILSKFIQQFDGQCASLQDFFRVASLVTEENLDYFFDTWYRQKGLVEVKVLEKTTPLQHQITLKQVHLKKNKHTEIFLDFFAVNLTNKQIFKDHVLLNKQKKILKLKKAPRDLIWSPGTSSFSSPVKITLQNDAFWEKVSPTSIPDLFQKLSVYNLWQITQELIKRSIYHPDQFTDLLLAAFSTLLADHQTLPLNFIFPTLKSLVLEPGQTLTLANLYEHLKKIKRTVANHFIDLWPQLYAHFEVTSEYQFNETAFLKRKMKHLILQFWLQSDHPPYDLALHNLQKSNNFTDRYNALSALVSSHYPDILNLLDQLNWAKNKELYNKWLSMNALLDLSSILERLNRIVCSQDFKMTNPNNLYSLLHCFGTQNLFRFHRQEVYAWYSQLILRIESFNPSVAATLTQNLILTKGLDPQTLQAQKEQLTFLHQQASSNNVLEIVNKGI